MELTKADKRQLRDIIKRGVLRRCEEWLGEMRELLNKDFGEDNAFDRCMQVTRSARDFYKEAMTRESYYRNTTMELGIDEMLHSGYLTLDDFAECRDEVRERFKWLLEN